MNFWFMEVNLKFCPAILLNNSELSWNVDWTNPRHTGKQPHLTCEHIPI